MINFPQTKTHWHTSVWLVSYFTDTQTNKQTIVSFPERNIYSDLHRFILLFIVRAQLCDDGHANLSQYFTRNAYYHNYKLLPKLTRVGRVHPLIRIKLEQFQRGSSTSAPVCSVCANTELTESLVETNRISCLCCSVLMFRCVRLRAALRRPNVYLHIYDTDREKQRKTIRNDAAPP